MDIPNKRILRIPQPSDPHLDFQTYRSLVGNAMESMNSPEGSDNTRFELQVLFGKVVELKRDTPPGTKPPATAVFAYSVIQVIWDSDSLDWVDKDGGFIWDGTAANSPLVRLIGNPGFTSTDSTNYGPLLTDAVVPIFPIVQNSGYDAPSEVDPGREYHDVEWFIIWNGEDPVVHPFKCTRSDDDFSEITVGATRGGTTDHLRDWITIPRGGLTTDTIERPTAETIAIPSTGYVYYDLDDSSVTPTVTLKHSVSWPPTLAADHYGLQLAFVQKSTDIDSIGQLQFSNFFFMPDNFTFKVSDNDTTPGVHEDKIKVPNDKGDVTPTPETVNKSLITYIEDPGVNEKRHFDIDFGELDPADTLTGSELVMIKQGALTNAHREASTQDIADLFTPAVKNSVEIDAGSIQLVGDELTPDDGDVYAKLTTKGWKTIDLVLEEVIFHDLPDDQFLFHPIGSSVEWVDATSIAGIGVKWNAGTEQFELDATTIDNYDATLRQYVTHKNAAADDEMTWFDAKDCDGNTITI